MKTITVDDSCQDGLQDGLWDGWFFNDPNTMLPSFYSTIPTTGYGPQQDTTSQAPEPFSSYLDSGSSLASPIASQENTTWSDSTNSTVGGKRHGSDHSGPMNKRQTQEHHHPQSIPSAGGTSPDDKDVEPSRRERNRTAAAKCRAKSKAAEEDLKVTQRNEQQRNTILKAAIDQLMDQRLVLKNELLCHSGCSHPIIDKYLQREAADIGSRASG